MGAVFFIGLLAILFFVALFFIIANIIIIVIWKVRKRKGKSPKKWWLILPVVLLVINIIVALLPVGYIVFLRYANEIENEIIYAQSGVMLTWPLGTHSYFEMDGNKYMQFRNNTDPFDFDTDNFTLGEPVANIKPDPAEYGAFGNFMGWFLAGKTMDEQNISTIYPIINDNEFELFYYSYYGNKIVCPENQIDVIRS